MEGANGLAMAAETSKAPNDEGIETPSDLLDFDKDLITQITSSFQKGTPVVPFSAKAQKQTVEAINFLNFYNGIGCEFMPLQIKYKIMQDFTEQWKFLKKCMEDKPDVPKITKELGVLRWSEAFLNYLAQCIGVQGAPLTYTMGEKIVGGVPGALEANKKEQVGQKRSC